MPLPNPAISIIVPCYNSAKFISRTLTALITEISSYPDVELILVDNNSTDNTLELLNQIANTFNTNSGSEVIRVLQATHGQGVNVARNAGAAQANGDILLFTDHDDVVCPGQLAAFRQAFAADAQIVSGPYTEYTSDGKLIREMNTPELYSWDIPYGLGSNSGITRSGFEQIGGFDPDWRGGGDDADFFWRAYFAGMELVFVPDARIVHYMRDDEKATFTQFCGYGRAEARLYAKFRHLGMPRSPILRALVAWPMALLELAASYVYPKFDRRRALSRLGVRAGRLVQSLKQHTLYL